MNYSFDLVIIGGGTAGLSAAIEAANRGMTTVILERNKLGGSTIWDGSIPTKALMRSARAYREARLLDEYGISLEGAYSYHTDMVMSRVRSVIIKTGSLYTPEYLEKRGIAVFFGSPRFVNPHAVDLDGDMIVGRKFIIATGSKPMLPQVEGLAELPYLTPHNLFDLGRLPSSLAVLGAGKTGVEVAQAMAMLGVKVVLIDRNTRILSGEDEEAARMLRELLERDKITIRLGVRPIRADRKDSITEILVEDDTGAQSLATVERVFVAAGRTPNTEGIGLENIPLAAGPAGIKIDNTLTTSAEHIFACGDVTGNYRFSGTAEYEGRLAARNAHAPEKTAADYRAVPWGICTVPELAHLGLTEEEARRRHGAVRIFKADYRENDRAIVDGEDIGFAKVITDEEGHIIGAHILGSRATEVIHEYALAQATGLTLGQLGATHHAYPTIARIVKETGEQFTIRESLKEMEALAAAQ